MKDVKMVLVGVVTVFVLLTAAILLAKVVVSYALYLWGLS